MNTLQQLQDTFWSTRLEAMAAYRKMKEVEKTLYPDGLHFYTGIYTKAWQAHQKASMALFLVECEVYNEN